MERRDFLDTTLFGLFGLASFGFAKEPLFRISLAEWSHHRALFAGELTHLDFITRARKDYGLDAVEYVNQFFMDKARDERYLAEMKSRADGEGVRSLLIMCDNEGDLGDPVAEDRARAVENHRKWVEAAKFLGCHSIRVNARSNPDLPFEEQEKLAADGLRSLCELADPHGIGVLVENHGGLSSNGTWLSGVMKRVDHPRVGTLPDFGNFRLRETPEEWYDRYKGVEELMPFARAVSAKSHDFDEKGEETTTDFHRMMRIVLDAGYRGYVGIEYEGERLPEAEGVQKTKALLVRVAEELSAAYPGK
jgi:sugar phosphate isomerase/epimerase